MWNPYVIIEWLVEARWLSDDILILEPHRPNIMNKCPGIEGPFIFINHISDDTIHIRRYIDPEYVLLQHILTSSTTHNIQFLRNTWFFWGLLPGMRPWRNWRSRRANVETSICDFPQKQGSWLREKWRSNGKTGKGWKRGELRHVCWAHLMHLATGNREP